MENIATPCATARSAHAPTTLDLLTRGGVASRAYLDVERTLDRARRMLADDAKPAPIAAYRALATRCRLHAEQLRHDHVREATVTLPAGITTLLHGWDSDHARLTFLLLHTCRQQCEERIAVLVRGAAS